jgi:hypothetical protein
LSSCLPRTRRDAGGGKGEVTRWLWWKKPFSALFIAAATRFNSGVAILHIQPVQSLDAPELELYLTRPSKTEEI